MVWPSKVKVCEMVATEELSILIWSTAVSNSMLPELFTTVADMFACVAFGLSTEANEMPMPLKLESGFPASFSAVKKSGFAFR